MTVKLEIADGVALVVLNRPAVRNAIDLATATALAAVLDEIDEREDVHAAVLTGGGAVFCSGMDLKAYEATGEVPLDTSRGALGIAGRPPLTPLLAAVEGWAVGGGFEVALACDLIVAAEDARFALPEVKRGRIASGGGVLRLPQRIPRNIAMEVMLTGEPMTAPEAYRLGLVNRIVPAGGAVAAALALASVIAANAPLAVRTTKKIVNAATGWPADEAFARQAPLVAPLSTSPEAAEGTRAFLEKRAPVWSIAEHGGQAVRSE